MAQELKSQGVMIFRDEDEGFSFSCPDVTHTASKRLHDQVMERRRELSKYLLVRVKKMSRN